MSLRRLSRPGCTAPLTPTWRSTSIREILNFYQKSKFLTPIRKVSSMKVKEFLTAILSWPMPGWWFWWPPLEREFRTEFLGLCLNLMTRQNTGTTMFLSWRSGEYLVIRKFTWGLQSRTGQNLRLNSPLWRPLTPRTQSWVLTSVRPSQRTERWWLHKRSFHKKRNSKKLIRQRSTLNEQKTRMQPKVLKEP